MTEEQKQAEDPSVQVPEREQLSGPIEQQEALKAAIEKYRSRIDQWVDAHGSFRGLPLVPDGTGGFVWVSRSFRRQQARANRKGTRPSRNPTSK